LRPNWLLRRYPVHVVEAVESIENGMTWAIFIASAVFEVFALLDAATRPAQSYIDMGRLTKPAWLLILTVALLTCVAFRSPIGIFGLLGLVAASVYMADVRPAIAVRRGRR